MANQICFANSPCFKETPKVYLIINSGAQNDSVVTIRPNLGRRTESKGWFRKRSMDGALTATNPDQAMRIWKREFELGDIPANEIYQFSCPGRHQEVSNIIMVLLLLPLILSLFQTQHLLVILPSNILPVIHFFWCNSACPQQDDHVCRIWEHGAQWEAQKALLSYPC